MFNLSAESQKKTNQSARHFARGNLKPLKRGIEVQLVGLRGNVEKLSLCAGLDRSKTLSSLVVTPHNHAEIR